MISTDYIEAYNFKDDKTVDFSVHMLVNTNICRSSGGDNLCYANIERMELQLLPLYINHFTHENGFFNSIPHNNQSHYLTFDLEINHDNKEVSFFHHDIILPSEIRGCGIGRYAVSQLVKWGKERAPGYKVKPIRLSYVDAHDDKSRDLRNAFYEKAGFSLDFRNDKELRNGQAKAITLNQLSCTYDQDKICIKVPQKVISSASRDLIQLERKGKAHYNGLIKYRQKMWEYRRKLFRLKIAVAVVSVTFFGSYLQSMF